MIASGCRGSVPRPGSHDPGTYQRKLWSVSPFLMAPSFSVNALCFQSRWYDANLAEKAASSTRPVFVDGRRASKDGAHPMPGWIVVACHAARFYSTLITGTGRSSGAERRCATDKGHAQGRCLSAAPTAASPTTLPVRGHHAASPQPERSHGTSSTRPAQLSAQHPARSYHAVSTQRDADVLCQV